MVNKREQYLRSFSSVSVAFCPHYCSPHYQTPVHHTCRIHCFSLDAEPCQGLGCFSRNHGLCGCHKYHRVWQTSVSTVCTVVQRWDMMMSATQLQHRCKMRRCGCRGTALPHKEGRAVASAPAAGGWSSFPTAWVHEDAVRRALGSSATIVKIQAVSRLVHQRLGEIVFFSTALTA